MEQWPEIRQRVLVGGESKRAILRETGMHRLTLEKILAHSQPPGYRQSKARKSQRSGRMKNGSNVCRRRRCPRVSHGRSLNDSRKWIRFVMTLLGSMFISNRQVLSQGLRPFEIGIESPCVELALEPSQIRFPVADSLRVVGEFMVLILRTPTKPRY
jgi:hypothetical protein